uniref:Tim44 domain-containing protein n=1 Tax=Desulfobacca acetoxidans TaxID=60893 RepID=A0A7C5ENB2_9BACT
MLKKEGRLAKYLTILALIMLLGWVLPSEAMARAGRGLSGGGSFGSRGSRSAAPVRPYTPPSPSTVRPTTPPLSQPSRPTTPPPAMATPSPTGGFWSSFGGGILGGLAGGMLARWLFGGSTTALADTKSGGYGGPGLLDLILLAGIGLLVYYIIRKRREEAALAQGAYESRAVTGGLQPPYYEQPSPVSEAERDLETGLAHIQQLDPFFTEDRFRDQVMDNFFKIQGAWADRDMSSVKHLLTDEMFRLLQEDAAKMRAEGHINRLENIAVREVNITEAWQEAGQDFITVRIYANLLDYTIDEKTGEIVSGSKTEPVKFEEYWTFTRPVGNHPWVLTAINQAE